MKVVDVLPSQTPAGAWIVNVLMDDGGRYTYKANTPKQVVIMFEAIRIHGYNQGYKEGFRDGKDWEPEDQVVDDEQF